MASHIHQDSTACCSNVPCSTTTRPADHHVSTTTTTTAATTTTISSYATRQEAQVGGAATTTAACTSTSSTTAWNGTAGGSTNHNRSSSNSSSSWMPTKKTASSRIYALAGCLFLLYMVNAGRLFWSLLDSSNDLHDNRARSVFWLQESARRSEHFPMRSNTNQHPRMTTPYAKDPRLPFWDRNVAETVLQTRGASAVRQVLTAYLEPRMNDTVPGTGVFGDIRNYKDHGIPPDLIVPLPLRTVQPSDLRSVTYPQLQTCHDMPGKYPTDAGLVFDPVTGAPVIYNGDPNYSDAYTASLVDKAEDCPIDADPFLPWIHDVFATPDGTAIEFIAQNKRRCKTGTHSQFHLDNLIPQVALMQPVSVQRLTSEDEAIRLAPELWHPQDASPNSSSTISTPRYRLAPREEADEDGMTTRFICQFHLTDFAAISASATSGYSEPPKILVGETLSQYPLDYEYLTYRKSRGGMLTPRGRDNVNIWLSSFRFSCPVPESLQHLVASGQSVLSDGTASLTVDVIPIRTSVRYEGEIYLSEAEVGPRHNFNFMNATRAWGSRHVLPRVEASGRWTHIPICAPPAPATALALAEQQEQGKDSKVGFLQYAQQQPNPTQKIASENKGEKPFFLTGCTWTSSHFRERGTKGHTRNSDRLEEWLTFHFMVGFDHMYVYDNSGAHTNETNLRSVVAKFPADKVTYIDWPHVVCNNNIPGHESPGERSSQYAAETSCRARYSHLTQWMSFFDTDEYFVPMGKYDNLQDMLRSVDQQGNQIVSMGSTRSTLRMEATEPVLNGTARQKLPNATFLEAYNCDTGGLPKPKDSGRARKQIYRTDYVLHHYVHYTVANKNHLRTYTDDWKRANYTEKFSWNRLWADQQSTERFLDDLTEATMVHAKSITVDATRNYREYCKPMYTGHQACRVATPYPPHSINAGNTSQDIHRSLRGSDPVTGFYFNCYINTRVEEYWVPKLRRALGL